MLSYLSVNKLKSIAFKADEEMQAESQYKS
jgi:hypothetical protein